jgi:hypothetical protein
MLNSVLNQNPQVYGPQEMQGPLTEGQYYSNMPMQDMGENFLSEYEMPLEQQPLQAQTIQQEPLQVQQPQLPQPVPQQERGFFDRILNGSDGKGGILGYSASPQGIGMAQGLLTGTGNFANNVGVGLGLGQENALNQARIEQAKKSGGYGYVPSSLQELEALKKMTPEERKDFWRVKRQQQEDAFGTGRGREAGKETVANERSMMAIESINMGTENAKSIASELELSGRLGAPIGSLIGDPVYDRLSSQLARIIPEIRVAAQFPASGFSDADREMLERAMGNPNMTVGALLQVFDDVITQGNARSARMQGMNSDYGGEFNYGGMPDRATGAGNKTIKWSEF